MFQRLERVKERLYTDYLPDYLDTPRKAWYLRTTATYLTTHLLEGYRRHVEDTLNTRGLEAIPPSAKRYLKFSMTQAGRTLVQVVVDSAETERVATTLTRMLQADEQDHAWDNLARRLATDISTWAFERMDNTLGSATIQAMNEATFDATLLTYAWPDDPTPLHDRVHHFLNLTAQQAAFDMMTTLEARAPSLIELEYLLGFQETAPSPLSLQVLLREGHVTVLSAAHYQAVREALALNTFRHHEGIPWPTALLTAGGARGVAQLRPILVDTHPNLPPAEREVWAQRMWQQREALSDLDADALDALSALWLYQARTPQEDAVADVDELLALRGLRAKRGGQGRRGGYMPEQRTAMLQTLNHLQNLWLDMSALEVYDVTRTGTRRRTRTRQAIQSRAFTITDLFGQTRLDGGFDIEKFLFRPGTVFAHFLFGPGRQTALLAAQALRYDPYRQTWEKRLARYLSYQWRCKAHDGRYWQPFRVVTLLTAVGAALDTRKPSRTREHLEKTLDTLLQDHVIAAWQYDRWDEACTGSRGWAPHWLQTTLLIEPPEVIADTYHHIEQHEAPKQKGLAAMPALGERLKHHRKALGLSQMQAAEQIGIDQGYLSRLERGKARYSADTQKRILHWLSGQAALPAPPPADQHA